MQGANMVSEVALFDPCDKHCVRWAVSNAICFQAHAEDLVQALIFCFCMALVQVWLQKTYKRILVSLGP